MHSQAQFLIERLTDDLPLPARQTEMSAGLDLRANISEKIIIKKGARALIPTGIKVALPFGFEAQVRSRSGLALKHGVAVLNSPGTIDADFRGEIGVVLINHGEADFSLQRGDRIAQMIISKIEIPAFQEVASLPETTRGTGGYGSTGT
jgi:dUTP pyrophosphatase